MKRIFKYKIDAEQVEIPMPVGAKILHVDVQHTVICLWAEVDDSQFKTEHRIFLTINTGQHIPKERNLEHIGTVILDNGYLVKHIYEDLWLE